MTDAIRLSKRLTQLYECSRREAELLIEGGWVTVDGAVIEEPFFKVQDQIVTLHPDATADPVEPVTLLLHKPAACDADKALALVNPESQAADDSSPIRLLKKHFVHQHILMPLENTACGLQVFSQDQRVIRKLTEDACKTEQEFIVEVTGKIAPDGLQKLNHGLTRQGKALPAAKVSWQNETRLRFALKDPQAGQIAQMCASVGLAVVTMKRIRIGRRSMGSLPAGQWRYLPAYEKF